MWLLSLSLGASSARADDLSLLLHDPRQRSAPLDRCDVPLCVSLLALIEGASDTLDLAFYGFRNQTRLLGAVTAAQERGVRVRIVVDVDTGGHNYYSSTSLWRDAFEVRTDQAVDLESAARRREFSVPERCPRPEGYAGPLQCLAMDLGDRCYLTAHVSRDPIVFEGEIMHNKFAVADQRRVWTGSANASDSGTGGYNANLAMILDSPTVARWYTHEFEQMFTHGRFHGSKERASERRHWIEPGAVHVSSYLSPQDRPLSRHVRPLIQQATEQIDIAVFFLTHKHVAQDLIEAHRRGVRIRILLDATAALNEYSKHEILRAAGIPVKIEPWGGKMHAKSAVIDGRIVIGGSMNWTSAGERGNDENTLVIRSVSHAAQYQAWFEALWSSIDDRWLYDRPAPESADSGTACTDGVDNDFDHRIDAGDPGCSASPPPLPELLPFQIVTTGGEPCAWSLLEGPRR
ncbi:MAG TPA: hypothetical protein ENK18_23815 [Deltaproteobacteria bacterium]|nr:hypothetical protein [Deltaproteobacteria bacterium]